MPIKRIQFDLEAELPKLPHLNDTKKEEHLDAMDLGSKRILTTAEDQYTNFRCSREMWNGHQMATIMPY